MNVSVQLDSISDQPNFSAKVQKRFAEKVKQDLDVCDPENPEEYITNCITNAYNQVILRERLPKSKKKRGYETISCGVCMEGVYANSCVRKLECGHTCHKRCIDNWVFKYNNYNCPECKTMLCNSYVHGAKTILTS